MEILFVLTGFGVGFAAGCVVAWVLAGFRTRAATGVAAELREQLGQKEEELRQSRAELNDERQARVRAETLLGEAQKNLE